MPVWSNQSTPPGPLNYVQIDDLIAFIRAHERRDLHGPRRRARHAPKIDPLTGKVKTFTGWRDPNYQPAPDATPYPACWKTEFAAPSAAPGASGSPGASAAPGGLGLGGPVRERGWRRRERPHLDRGLGHRLHHAQRDRARRTPASRSPSTTRTRASSTTSRSRTAPGPRSSRARSSPASRPRPTTCPRSTRARTPFFCSVHANMTGTLTVKE